MFSQLPLQMASQLQWHLRRITPSLNAVLPAPMLFFPNREKSQGTALGSLKAPPDIHETSLSLHGIFILVIVCNLLKNQEEKAGGVKISLADEETAAQWGSVTFPSSLRC